MVAGTLLWVSLQVLSCQGTHGSTNAACSSNTGACPAKINSSLHDHFTLMQRLVGVKHQEDPLLLKHHRSTRSVALHLKKEHIWALSKEIVADENVKQFEDIADRTMLAVFGDMLQHLSSTQQAELQQSFRNAGRTDHTRLGEMMSTACWLDDLQSQGSPHFSVPPSIKDMLVSAGILNNEDEPAEQPTEGTATAKTASGVAQSDVKAADTSCGNFAGHWQQSEHNSINPLNPCDVYSADVMQDGCTLTAKSDDAWWGNKNISLEATGNSVEIKLSMCGHLFKAVLSDDGQTATWNGGCTWTKVPSYFEGFQSFVSRHGASLSIGIFLISGLGFLAYVRQSRA